MHAVSKTDIPGLQLLNRGKVRDIYAVGDDHLLLVASDRISAFDVVLPDPVPGKGAPKEGNRNVENQGCTFSFSTP